MLFGHLTPAEALILGIVLIPTDAALGQAVITEPRIPQRIRRGLKVESGLNDGICVPLLFAASAIVSPETPVDVDARWISSSIRFGGVLRIRGSF